MKIKYLKSTKKYWVLLLLLPLIYTAFVLVFVWWNCHSSQFHYGKNGPLDAYRHTLASAVVAYTASPKLVSVVTFMMERDNKPANLMDKHNNAIGANIGQHAQSLADIKAKVATQIAAGSVNKVAPTQTTWLATQYWRESLFW